MIGCFPMKWVYLAMNLIVSLEPLLQLVATTKTG